MRVCAVYTHTARTRMHAHDCTTWNCTNSSCLRIPIVAAVVGVDANHGVHRIRRLDRLAQEQVRLHELVRSDRNQPIRHIVFMNIDWILLQQIETIWIMLQLDSISCNRLELTESCCNRLNPRIVGVRGTGPRGRPHNYHTPDTEHTQQ